MAHATSTNSSSSALSSCDTCLIRSVTLKVKTKANKLNSLGINWRYKLSVNIKIFFGFDIIASKEYHLTIVGSLEVYSKVTRKHTVSSSAYSIAKT